MNIKDFYKFLERGWQPSKMTYLFNEKPNLFLFIVPKHLNHVNLLEEFPDVKLPNSYREDEAKLILHLITEQIAFQHHCFYEDNGLFVILDNNFLKDIGIKNYNEYITYFIECGIIEQSTSCSKKGIRFTLEYTEHNEPFYYDNPIFNELYLLKRDRVDKYVQQEYPNLVKWWKTNKIQIDYTPAIAFVHYQLEDYPRCYMKFRDAFAKYNSSLFIIQKIAGNNYYFDADSTGFYSLFSYLPKELRMFIRFDGKILVSLGLIEPQQNRISDYSDLISKDVVFQISKYNPEIPLFIHHGSIVTTLEYQDKVKDILIKSITDNYNDIVPDIVIEEWV